MRLKVVVLGIVVLVFVACTEKIVYKYDITEPVIVRGPEVVEICDTCAVLMWETDEPSYAEIIYGRSVSETVSLFEHESRQKHRVRLGNLEPYMTYYFKLRVRDFFGNGPVETEFDSFRTKHNVFSYVREGWEFLITSKSDSAKWYFYKAYSEGKNVPDSRAAIGWFRMCADSMVEAKEMLFSSLELNRYLKIGLAGLSCLYLIEGSSDSSIYFGEKLLEIDELWVYDWCSSISYRTVRVVLSEAYFQEGDLERAKYQIDIIWPENGIVPDDPTTWIVNGDKCDSYEMALLAAIIYLKNKYLNFAGAME